MITSFLTREHGSQSVTITDDVLFDLAYYSRLYPGHQSTLPHDLNTLER